MLFFIQFRILGHFEGALRRDIEHHHEVGEVNNVNTMLAAKMFLKKLRDSRSLRSARLAIPATNKALIFITSPSFPAPFHAVIKSQYCRTYSQYTMADTRDGAKVVECHAHFRWSLCWNCSAAVECMYSVECTSNCECKQTTLQRLAPTYCTVLIPL